MKEWTVASLDSECIPHLRALHLARGAAGSKGSDGADGKGDDGELDTVKSLAAAGSKIRDDAPEDEVQSLWANKLAESCASYIARCGYRVWCPEDTHSAGPTGIKHGLKPDITFFCRAEDGQLRKVFVGGCNVWDVKRKGKLGGDSVVYQALSYAEEVRDAALSTLPNYYVIFVAPDGARFFKFSRTTDVLEGWQMAATPEKIGFPAALDYILAVMAKWSPLDLYSSWPGLPGAYVASVLGTGVSATVVQLETSGPEKKEYAAKIPTELLLSASPAIAAAESAGGAGSADAVAGGGGSGEGAVGSEGAVASRTRGQLSKREAAESTIRRTASHEARIYEALGDADGLPRVVYNSHDVLIFEDVCTRLKFLERSNVCELFEVLRRAREKGIVHRDIRPENLMKKGSKLMVIDWAFAVEGRAVPTECGALSETTYGFEPQQYEGVISFASENILKELLKTDGVPVMKPSFADDLESAVLLCLYYALAAELRTELREGERELATQRRAVQVLRLRRRFPASWARAIAVARTGDIDAAERCVLEFYPNDA